MEHHLTLTTTNEETTELVNVIHNMNKWLHEGIIKKDTFVNIHNIIRQQLDTENFLCIVGHRDEREEKNEYAIRVIEFPEKSDGTLRGLKLEDEKFFLLSLKETVIEQLEKIADTKGDNKNV